MNIDEQIKKLASHLRELANRLQEQGTDWTTWVIGNLEGTADILELEIKKD